MAKNDATVSASSRKRSSDMMRCNLLWILIPQLRNISSIIMQVETIEFFYWHYHDSGSSREK